MANNTKIIMHKNTRQAKVMKTKEANKFLESASWVEIDKKGNIIPKKNTAKSTKSTKSTK